jgi:hypothetical protein
MNRQPSIRYPAPWEANILACGTLLMLLVFTGILSAFFPIPVVLIVGQLLFIVPSLTWIVVRHLPLQATFRLYPVTASTIIWGVLIGLAC